MDNKLNIIRWSGLLIALTAVLSSGCRSNISTSTSGSPHAASVPLEDGAEIQRSYYQTRSVIRFTLNAEDAQTQDRIMLVNETNGSTLFDEETQNFVDDHRAETSGYSLTTADGVIEIKVYLKSEEMVNQFEYGTNTLRVEVEGDGPNRFIEREVVISDFTAFGSGSARYRDQSQSQGGFQGWFPRILHPVVRAKDSEGQGFVLRTGFFHAVNH